MVNRKVEWMCLDGIKGYEIRVCFVDGEYYDAVAYTDKQSWYKGLHQMIAKVTTKYGVIDGFTYSDEYENSIDGFRKAIRDGKLHFYDHTDSVRVDFEEK